MKTALSISVSRFIACVCVRVRVRACVRAYVRTCGLSPNPPSTPWAAISPPSPLPHPPPLTRRASEVAKKEVMLRVLLEGGMHHLHRVSDA
jgi:hypothetical protein